MAASAAAEHGNAEGPHGSAVRALAPVCLSLRR